MRGGNINTNLQYQQFIINNNINQSQDESSIKDQVSSLCSKKISKPKRRKKEKCIFGLKLLQSPLLYPIDEQTYFPLNGNFCIYLTPQNRTDRDYSRKSSFVQSYELYHQAQLVSIQFFKNFELPIKLLEKSQDQDKYFFAQQLKEIQQIFNKSVESIQTISKSYSRKKEELAKLSAERQNYRKQLIKKYISENFKEEDFFSVAEFGENLEFQQIEISSLSFSKPFIALLGIEEKDLVQYLMHVGIADFIFLSNQEQFYGVIYNSLKNHNQSNNTTYYKDLMFITMDNLKIFCDTELKTLNINYPPELEYRSDHSPLHFNQLFIFKFNLTPQHLKSILEQRRNDISFAQKEDLQYQQSFEYSLLSSIFLDKFYPKQLQIDTHQEERQVKICRYRLINS